MQNVKEQIFFDFLFSKNHFSEYSPCEVVIVHAEHQVRHKLTPSGILKTNVGVGMVEL